MAFKYNDSNEISLEFLEIFCSWTLKKLKAHTEQGSTDNN